MRKKINAGTKSESKGAFGELPKALSLLLIPRLPDFLVWSCRTKSCWAGAYSLRTEKVKVRVFSVFPDALVEYRSTT
jgi:hypothetical protein